MMKSPPKLYYFVLVFYYYAAFVFEQFYTITSNTVGVPAGETSLLLGSIPAHDQTPGQTQITATIIHKHNTKPTHRIAR